MIKTISTDITSIKILLKRFVIIIGVLFCSLPLFSQPPQSTSRKAIKFYQESYQLYQQVDYNNALVKINQAINEDTLFVDAFLLQAELNQLLGDSKAEIGAYLRIKSIDSVVFPYLFYNLGLAYWDVGEYYKSLSSFRSFQHVEKTNKLSRENTEKYIVKCDFAINLLKNPVPFDPRSLGTNLDSPYEQYWPSLPIDAKTLIFTMLIPDSTRFYPDGSMAFQEDFYITTLVKGIWQKPVPIGLPINTLGNEGAQQISADGSILVFTGCNRNDGVGKCDIYFATKNNQGGWERPFNAGRIINSASSDKQPCLSPDGRMIYFSSDREGGFGKMDIWVAIADDNGKWSQPRNLGRPINTPDDDICPFIHPDNQTLYFSSDGHPGMGSKDIFISRRDSIGRWSAPVNLGYPINTYRDEIGLVVDNTGKTAYFSSDYNSKAKKIYSFTLPVSSQPIAVSYVRGLVFDALSKVPLKADVQLLDVYTGDTLMSVMTKAQSGDFLVSLPIGKSYALLTSSKGYLFHSHHFDLTQNFDASKPYTIEIGLEKPLVGANIILQNIFFKTNSYELLPSSHAELVRMEQFIKANPNVVFEVGGHTDNTGDAIYNQQLSEKRAKTVYDYLISKNINAAKLLFKGYGQNIPVENNQTAAGRSANRRTELKVIAVN